MEVTSPGSITKAVIETGAAGVAIGGGIFAMVKNIRARKKKRLAIEAAHLALLEGLVERVQALEERNNLDKDFRRQMIESQLVLLDFSEVMSRPSARCSECPVKEGDSKMDQRAWDRLGAMKDEMQRYLGSLA